MGFALTIRLIALSTVGVLACAHVVAQDLPQHRQNQWIGYGAEADFNSAYVWRGIVLDNRVAVQPSFWVSGHGFNFTAWSSLALNSRPGDSRLGASDLILTYTHRWNKVTLEPGLEAYLQPGSEEIGDRKTMEGSLRLSFPVGPLRVFNLNTFDVLAYKGSYFGEAGVSYERLVAKPLEFALVLSSGWASSKFNDAYIGVNKAAFNLVAAHGSLTYNLKTVYIRPHFEFSRIADRQLREELSSPTVLTFGLAIGIDL
jgi:hypothetical protein